MGLAYASDNYFGDILLRLTILLGEDYASGENRVQCSVLGDQCWNKVKVPLPLG